jgi:HEAT repeat protein
MTGHRPLPAVLLSIAVTAVSCRTSESSGRPSGEPEPFVPLPDEEPQPIGFFLANFDRSLEQWSQLELAAASPRDRNALDALEHSMQERASERREELLEALETGPPVNRRIAAAALGFTQDPTVLGALVATLDERDSELVQKALLGIGVLAIPETPVAEIGALVVNAPDAWTRNNAAFALLALARAGNTTAELATACRVGVADAEPGVRAQCASALGVCADPNSVPALRALLSDDQDLVALAGTLALARIGREHLVQKGAAARALAEALEAAEGDRREHVLRALRWLAQSDLGEEAAPWLAWAAKLP